MGNWLRFEVHELGEELPDWLKGKTILLPNPEKDVIEALSAEVGSKQMPGPCGRVAMVGAESFYLYEVATDIQHASQAVNKNSFTGRNL